MQQHHLTHKTVRAVEISTFRNATRPAGHMPVTPDGFAYSIAFPVACLVVRGQVGVQELSASTLSDPDILRISRATTLIDDPQLIPLSDGKRWAQFSITLHDGRRLEDESRTPRGDTDMSASNAKISERSTYFTIPSSAQTLRIK